MFVNPARLSSNRISPSAGDREGMNGGGAQSGGGAQFLALNQLIYRRFNLLSPTMFFLDFEFWNPQQVKPTSIREPSLFRAEVFSVAVGFFST